MAALELSSSKALSHLMHRSSGSPAQLLFSLVLLNWHFRGIGKCVLKKSNIFAVCCDIHMGLIGAFA